MRKNILSLSIAAMIGGLGLAGGAATAVIQPRRRGCAHCIDPDGEPCCPTYGRGPLTAQPGFTPAPDEPGMGTWWCADCGDGRP